MKIDRPLPLRIVNAFGGILGSLGLKSHIDVDKLLGKARKITGLKDFGSDFDLQPLRILAESIRNEAHLNAVGLAITKIRLANVLANRLRVEDYISKYPESLDQEVDPILLITGLQRTGTTKLHRLLSGDPNTRFLRSWEVLNPTPLGKKDDSDRISKARLSEKALRYMSPKFFAIHPVEYDAPEEEVLLLDMAFLSTVPEATMHVPTYANWASRQDQTPAYEYMKRVILVLQHQKRRQRWVMKSPHHLEFLETFCSVFPKTQIIQTHRNPIDTLASFCSMVFHSRAIFSDELSPAEIGRHWSSKVSDMLQRSLEFRHKRPELFHDVYYQSLVKDSKDAISNLYQSLGIDLWKSFDETVERIERANSQYKYGRHKYSLQEFDLTPEILRKLYKDYLIKFGFVDER